MKTEFIPKTLSGKLHWLGEEMAEVFQALEKTQRFREEYGIGAIEALHLYDPTVAPADRETNHAWILRELSDLKVAIATFEGTAIICASGVMRCGKTPGETFSCIDCAVLHCSCSSSAARGESGPDQICVHCWKLRGQTLSPSPKKKPHAKKQSQQAQSKSPKKVRAKKGAVTAGQRRARRLLTIGRRDHIGH